MGHGLWTAFFLGKGAVPGTQRNLGSADRILKAFVAELRMVPAEGERAYRAVRRIAERLDAHFVTNGEAGARESFRILGGHATGTAIRPGNPVDMLYVLPRRPAAWIRPGPDEIADLADAVRHALADWIDAQRTSAPFWFAAAPDGCGPVNLAPAIATRTGQYAIPPLNSADRWRTVDPAAERARLFEADQSAGGMATPLLMILKAWRRARGVVVQPFALRLMVCEYFRDQPMDTSGDLADLFRDFLRWSTRPRVADLLTPGAFESVHIGREWRNHAHAAAELFDTAHQLHDYGIDAPALYRWRTLFGPRFPTRRAQALMNDRPVEMGLRSTMG